MHKLLLSFHDSLGTIQGFKITMWCEWVKQRHVDELATFTKYEEALQYAKEKSHELGLELVDYCGDILDDSKTEGGG